MPTPKSGQCISIVSSLDSYSHWLNALLALFPGVVLSLPFGLSFDKGRGFLCWAVMHPTFGCDIDVATVFLTFTLQECKLLVVVGVTDLDGVLGAQTIFVGPLG